MEWALEALKEPFFEGRYSVLFLLFDIVNMERETQAAFGCADRLDLSSEQILFAHTVTDCFDVSLFLL